MHLSGLSTLHQFLTREYFEDEGKNAFMLLRPLNRNDGGGACGPTIKSTNEQDRRIKGWAEQHEKLFYEPLFSNCRDFIRRAIDAGQ